MTHYLLRIIKYYWDPLTKSVKHIPIASKSITLPEDHDVNAANYILSLLTKDFPRKKVVYDDKVQESI